MNIWNERRSDSENFGIIITRFGVVVEKIWNFKVSGLFWWIFLGYGLFWNYFSKTRGLTVKSGIAG
jgi:hypothetical protein